MDLRVVVTVAGFDQRPEVHWPAGWPIPPVGAQLIIPKGDATLDVRGPIPADQKTVTVYVKHVTWVLADEDESGHLAEPYVYISLGPNRPNR
jgi:hypothetical protein